MERMHGLMVFENRMLWKIFGSKRKYQESGEKCSLKNHKLYISNVTRGAADCN
jgi:hypothetical protein